MEKTLEITYVFDLELDTYSRGADEYKETGEFISPSNITHIFIGDHKIESFEDLKDILMRDAQDDYYTINDM